MPEREGVLLAGVYPVLQMPFHEDEGLDLDTLEREIEWTSGQGVDGVVTGMVSEVLRLAGDERDQVAATVCQAAPAGCGVVIAVGAESTVVARRHAERAERAGADALMAAPPVTTALPPEEIAGYYRALLGAVDVPVIVQDASAYVGHPTPVEVHVRLLEEFGDRVLFKPEADPIGPRLSALRDATGGSARIFEGSGGIALVDSHRRGIVGTMPAADLCWALVALWEALETGDEERAARISGPLANMISLQTSLDSFTAIEKHLLWRQGVFRNTIRRRPTGYRLDAETADYVDALFARLRRAVDA